MVIYRTDLKSVLFFYVINKLCYMYVTELRSDRDKNNIYLDILKLNLRSERNN